MLNDEIDFGTAMRASGQAGKLFYLVGPSGVGKDTLLRALAADDRLHIGLRIAQRYITRPPDPRGEQNRELDLAEFERREHAGEFLFSWASHGNHYAVGHEILAWLEAGDDVIVNGSRDYLPNAREIYPPLVVIWMTVDEAVLRSRLGARGREAPADIETRLARNHELERFKQPGTMELDNSGSIETTLSAFARLRSRAAAQSD